MLDFEPPSASETVALFEIGLAKASPFRPILVRYKSFRINTCELSCKC
jgi:hypothetical protein